MSFAAPLVLLALLALPLLGIWYAAEQHRRTRAALAFASERLTASVAPRRPGWRRHAPQARVALALAALIVAAARPRHTVTVPVRAATVMFANDVSDSMQATDVRPSRLVAAKRAATSFLNVVTPGIAAGSVEFARHATVLQSPTTAHGLTRAALATLRPGGGGTAIGDALGLALGAITTAPKVGGRRPPGAIILISDGVSNFGSDPILAALQAHRDGVRIYTVSIGTAHGTVRLPRGGREVTSAVPVDPGELRQIAAVSHGQAFRAADAAAVQRIYARLAKRLGQRRVQRGLIVPVAGAGLLLLGAGLALSLAWFGRLT